MIGIISKVYAYLENRRKVKKAIQDLSRCSDRELQDMGISRGIIRAVAEGRYNV